jgi:hypothetical protein
VAYAKVCLGLQLLLDAKAVPHVWFFEPSTGQEDLVAAEIAAVATRYPGARASVSVECGGALRDLPVIGEFPMFMLSAPRPPRAAPMTITDAMLVALLTMRDGAPRQYTYHEIATARALVRRGLAERRGDMPLTEYWVSITPDGLAALEAP